MNGVAELMQKTLFKNFDRPVKAFWYSKKEEGKIRPLKLSDEEAKWNFLKRANHDLRSDKMFCKLDVNKKTQSFSYENNYVVLIKRIPAPSNIASELCLSKKNLAGKWKTLKLAKPVATTL